MPISRREKLRALFYENRYLIVAFFIPFALMWLIYIALEVYPFGTNSVLVLDLNGQYVYFFEDLREKLLGGGSLLYTWTRTLGGEFMGIFAEYLASPLSFLVALFSKDHITEFLLVIILIKTGLMGTTMAYYLNKTHPTRKINAVIFSTCYALSAFAVVMAHNTMWIDNLILLPLVALGIEQLIIRGEFKLFVISLSLSLLTSFYIGYMMCIFVAVYFFYYYFCNLNSDKINLNCEPNHFWRSLIRIAIYSGIAICIAMIIVYPAYTSLQFGKNTFSDPTYTTTLRFDILDFITKLFPGSYDTVRPEGLPFVYCGTLTLILLPLYFLTSRIRWQERMMGGVILFLFLGFFSVNAIDIVWHGFQKPNWLNYRYSFMLIFIMLVMAYKAFGYIKHVNFKNVAIIVGVLTLVLLFIQKEDYKWVKDYGTIWFGIVCLGVFCVLLWLLYSKVFKGNVTTVIALFVCIEMFVAGLMNTVALDEDVVISSRTSYNNKLNMLQPIVDYVKDYDDSTFYRMEKTYHRKTNDPMRLGFMGISNSTSTLNRSIVDLMHRYGYTSASHWTQYRGGTPVSDALLGIKYVISDEKIDNGTHVQISENLTEDETFYTYYNPNALSIGYASSSDINNLQLTDYESPFELMNETVKSLLGENREIFTRVPVVKTDMKNITTGFTTQHKKYSKTNEKLVAKITFTLSVPANKPIYMYVPTDYPRECYLLVDGVSVGTFLGGEGDCVYYLGTFNEPIELNVSLQLKDEAIYIRNNFHYFFSLDNLSFNESFSMLSEGNLNVTKFTDTRIEGSINIKNGMDTVFTTIPFDEGWNVYIDGNKVQTHKVCDSLLAFNISEGEHIIELEYLPKCYVIGGTVSIIGIILFSLAIIIDCLKKRRAFASKLPAASTTFENEIEGLNKQEEDEFLSIDASNIEDLSKHLDEKTLNDNISPQTDSEINVTSDDENKISESD